MVKVQLPLILVFLLLTITATTQAHIFESIPSSQTLDEALFWQAARQQKVIEYASEFLIPPAPTPPKILFVEHVLSSLSRFILNKEVHEAQKSLLDPLFIPWSVGTHFSLNKGLCQKEGDYDFVLINLIKTAYALKNINAHKKVYNRILSELLTRRGGEIYKSFYLKNCPPFRFQDTENHLLMTNISQYLTNQLLLEREPYELNWDNEWNGMNVWILHYLQNFMKNDFSEHNSRPYQGYTVVALSVLHDYARDYRVKIMAQNILDYISAKWAAQSLSSVRYGSYRRQKKYNTNTLLVAGDRLVDWFVVQTGDYQRLAGRKDSQQVFANPYFAFMSALTSYRIPRLIKEYLFDRNKSDLHIISHSDPEIYFHGGDYLISAGGRYRNLIDAGTLENDVLPLSLTLQFTHSPLDLNELLHFKGHPRVTLRQSMCVHESFACGTRLHIPNFLKTCQKKYSTNFWEFYDLTTCIPSSYHYLVIYKRRSSQSDIKDYGFFEIRKKEEARTFENFYTTVLSKNKNLRLKTSGPQKYTNFKGLTIEFDISSPVNEYPILSVQNKKIQKNYNRWPLLQGPFLQSSGDGLITIQYKKKKIVLDSTHPLEPLRYEQ